MKWEDIAEELKMAQCAFQVSASETVLMQNEASEIILQLNQQLQVLISAFEELQIENSETKKELQLSKLDFNGAQMSITKLEQKLFNSDKEKTLVEQKLKNVENSLSVMDEKIQKLNIELSDAKTRISHKESENENLILQLKAANESIIQISTSPYRKELLTVSKSAELSVNAANDGKMDTLLLTIEEIKCVLQEKMKNFKLMDAAQFQELPDVYKVLESRDKEIADYQRMEELYKAQLATNLELIAKLRADLAKEEMEKAELSVNAANIGKMDTLILTIEEIKCILQEKMKNFKLMDAAQSQELPDVYKVLESRDKAIAERMEEVYKAQLATNLELIANLRADQLIAKEEMEKKEISSVHMIENSEALVLTIPIDSLRTTEAATPKNSQQQHHCLPTSETAVKMVLLSMRVAGCLDAYVNEADIYKIIREMYGVYSDIEKWIFNTAIGTKLYLYSQRHPKYKHLIRLLSASNSLNIS